VTDVSARKAVVEAYVDGFRRGDSAAILSCPTEDVVWEIHGHATVRGREDFAGAITEDTTPGLPTLEIERLVEEGDTVVAVGNGSVALAAGGRLVFVFCDVFTFAGDRIRSLASYQVNLSGTV
jgi:ketosteroid isomerase-like protein